MHKSKGGGGIPFPPHCIGGSGLDTCGTPDASAQHVGDTHTQADLWTTKQCYYTFCLWQGHCWGCSSGGDRGGSNEPASLGLVAGEASGQTVLGQRQKYIKTVGELCLQGAGTASGLPEGRLKRPCKALKGRLGERVRSTTLSYPQCDPVAASSSGATCGSLGPYNRVVRERGNRLPSQVPREDRYRLGIKPAAQKRLWLPNKNQNNTYIVKKLR